MASDGNGGAFITWMHFGGAGNGQYAALQRITPAGLIPSTVAATPALLPIIVSNHPNPFTTSTTVSLTLPRNAVVSAEVYDVAGRRVRAFDRGAMAAGASEFRFDGLDNNHRALPSGVYFLRVRADGNVFTRKIVITR
jgi:flagellar hook assembly protein FlgD